MLSQDYFLNPTIVFFFLEYVEFIYLLVFLGFPAASCRFILRKYLENFNLKLIFFYLNILFYTSIPKINLTMKSHKSKCDKTRPKYPKLSSLIKKNFNP